ncbi:unnamed protein product [Ceratitis capitata]|uniref:(Mediterranean fruit fly) hypothetical protein n=1 Tax=Ceratitis capitata TaxID=7213 RepID=A0A811UP03_CERCA|nr:unnamed protein product [Ceratitis capitata]
MSKVSMLVIYLTLIGQTFRADIPTRAKYTKKRSAAYLLSSFAPQRREKDQVSLQSRKDQLNTWAVLFNKYFADVIQNSHTYVDTVIFYGLIRIIASKNEISVQLLKGFCGRSAI